MPPKRRPWKPPSRQTGWRLTDILVTHHHADHTGGIVALKEHHHCRVTAPRRKPHAFPAVDVEVADGDEVKVGNLKARVLETPGHTAGHISYWLPDDQLAFVGDTLFSIGCGRVIEGTPEMMWASLLKLRALPDDTRVYCGHEYTAANIRFAKTVEPNNKELAAREQEVARLLAQDKPTIPSLLGAEKKRTCFCVPMSRRLHPRSACPDIRRLRSLPKCAHARTSSDADPCRRHPKSNSRQPRSSGCSD